MLFKPSVNSQLSIGRNSYRFTEHPAAKGMPHGQIGRRATVYQVIDEGGKKFALKVFFKDYRSPIIVESSLRLNTFSQTPGLNVCEREVLTREHYTALIEKYPDLEFAVLMPWVQGETWQELFVSHQTLPLDNTRILAGQMTVLMANLEQQGLAHCDIAGPNVMVDLPALNGAVSTVVSALFLVDVEEMYGPGFSKPEKLPAGTPGYNHKTAEKGLWSAESDRFAGAVMLAEMLTRHDERTRRISFQEQYFDPAEMQQNTDRYRLAVQSLKEQGDTLAADLFARAWFSQTLSECPKFSEWFVAINRPQQNNINPPTQPRHGATNPVGGWRGLGTPSGRISNPPAVTVPVEQIRPMLLKAAEEGRWMDVLSLSSQILQTAPADTVATNLQIKAQRLLQLEQAVQSLWQAAVTSGVIEDWDNCIRTITTIQYQAKNLERYEQLRREAENERQLAIQALTLQQLLEEKRWDEANALRNDLPFDHPKVAELLARMDMEVGNQLRSAQLTCEAQKALDTRSWIDAIHICREGLILNSTDVKLSELLDSALREQALDKQVAEALRLVGQSSAIGQWGEAEKNLRLTIQLQPARQSLQSQLDEIIQKRKWADQIELALSDLNQKPAEELFESLENIPDGFGSVDKTRLVLHEIEAWRTNIEIAKSIFDLNAVAGLLHILPDSRVDISSMEVWLRIEQDRESTLETAFQQMDFKAVEEVFANLPQNHPLRTRCRNWLTDYQKTAHELEEAHDAFNPEQVQNILGRVTNAFPRFAELSEWANRELESRKSLLEARARRDLLVVEQLLSELPAKHPVRKDTLVWLKEEKGRKYAVDKARAAYDLDRMGNLLAGIPENDAEFISDWQWLKTQQNTMRNIQDALETLDLERISKIIQILPISHPYHNRLETWLTQERDLRAQIQIFQKTYQLDEIQKLSGTLSIRHPLRPVLDGWLAKYSQIAADLLKARQTWEYKQVLTLLDEVSQDYPEWGVLHAWALEMSERNHRAEDLIASFNPDGLDAILGDWPHDDPKFDSMQKILANMRKENQDLTRLLADAESAMNQKDWERAIEICKQVQRKPKIGIRFIEISEIARQELEKRVAAEKLMIGMQDAVLQKRYAEAIWQADQAALLLPNTQPFARAGREMREKLINMAHTAERNRKWNDSKALWAALKTASVPPAGTQTRTEPVIASPKSTNDSLAMARDEMNAGNFEKAVSLAKQVNPLPLAHAAFISEILVVIRNQAQAAQNIGKWDKAKELWELLKKIKEENGH